MPRSMVLIDGVPAEPGTVVFGRRSQTLSATLEGAIAGCLSLVTNLDGTTSIVVDTNCVAPETIELILESTDAATPRRRPIVVYVFEPRRHRGTERGQKQKKGKANSRPSLRS